MQNLKTLFLTTFLIQLFSVNQSYAKFRFSKIKENIKDTINKATKQTKKTFNKLINKTKKEELSDKKDETREALFKAISNVGEAFVKGLNIYEKNLSKNLKKADEFIEKIFWAEQIEFMTYLEEAYVKSKDQARQILYNKLSEKYANTKAPLIDFAVEINEEGVQADKFIEKLNEFDKEKIEDKAKIEKLDKTLEKLVNIKSNIEGLSQITNELLQR